MELVLRATVAAAAAASIAHADPFHFGPKAPLRGLPAISADGKELAISLSRRNDYQRRDIVAVVNVGAPVAESKESRRGTACAPGSRRRRTWPGSPRTWTPRRLEGKRAAPYRALFVYEKRGDAWQAVVVHFSAVK